MKSTFETSIYTISPPNTIQSVDVIDLLGVVALICFIPILTLVITYYANTRTEIGYLLDQDDNNRPRSHSDWRWVPVTNNTAYKNEYGQVVRTPASGSFLFDSLDPNGAVISRCGAHGKPATLIVDNIERTGLVYPEGFTFVGYKAYGVYPAQVYALRAAGVRFSTGGKPFPTIMWNNGVLISQN